MTDWAVVIVEDWDYWGVTIREVIAPLSETDARARAEAHNAAVERSFAAYKEAWDAWHQRRHEAFGDKHPLSDEERAQLGQDPGPKGPEETRAIAAPLTP